MAVMPKPKQQPQQQPSPKERQPFWMAVAKKRRDRRLTDNAGKPKGWV